MGQNKPKIVVVGSSNMDLVVKSPRIPTKGETVLGGDFIMTPGGKGANQAVAAAKLGAEVYFIAKLGDDIFGRQSLSNFQKVGIHTEYVDQTEEAPSGVALITVDVAGDNVIVVAPGANLKLSPEDVGKAQPVIASSGAVAAQLEVPLETVEFAARLANDAGVPFILDPAPAQKLSPEFLKKVDVLTPNETEAEILTGIKVTDENSALVAAKDLLERGVKAVILTMGAQGYLLATKDAAEFVPSVKVDAVDATAAGDAFTGSLGVGLAQGKTLRDAALFANHVAALSVTKMGAQSSMPDAGQVENFIRQKSAQGVNDEKA
ncbi:MAG TPA: ribokinase [Sedimentisphaerales bacterium]|nr:ribokinase [Sedimentisphaerales bacterium]